MPLTPLASVHLGEMFPRWRPDGNVSVWLAPAVEKSAGSRRSCAFGAYWRNASTARSDEHRVPDRALEVTRASSRLQKEAGTPPARQNIPVR